MNEQDVQFYSRVGWNEAKLRRIAGLKPRQRTWRDPGLWVVRTVVLAIAYVCGMLVVTMDHPWQTIFGCICGAAMAAFAHFGWEKLT